MASAIFDADLCWLFCDDDLHEQLVAKHISGGVLRVGDAVAEEDDRVAGLGGEAELFVLRFGKHAQRKAFGVHGLDFAAAAEERLGRAGVGDLQGLVVVVPHRVEHGDILRVEAALLERIVELPQHRRGRKRLAGRERMMPLTSAA